MSPRTSIDRFRPAATLLLLAGTASTVLTGCSMFEPIGRMFTGEPAEPIHAANAPEPAPVTNTVQTLDPVLNQPNGGVVITETTTVQPSAQVQTVQAQQKQDEPYIPVVSPIVEGVVEGVAAVVGGTVGGVVEGTSKIVGGTVEGTVELATGEKFDDVAGNNQNTVQVATQTQPQTKQQPNQNNAQQVAANNAGNAGTPIFGTRKQNAKPYRGETERPAPPPPSAVFPASYNDLSDEEGFTTSPEFGLFGEMPNASASGNTHTRNFDPTQNLRQVSFGTVGKDFDPAISPDGSRVFFASTMHSPTADIYAKNVQGTAVAQLTNNPAHDVMPAVSADGNRVAFASNRNGSYDIYVTNADGGQATQVTSDPSHELHPTFSPDGRYIAYCRLGASTDRWEIWLVDTTQPGAVSFLTFGLFPEWHPSRDTIVFQRSRDRGDRFFSVWTVDIENGEAVQPTEIASSGVAAVINPSWSTDGEYISFSTILNPDTNHADGPEAADLWLVRADGTGRANLTGGHFVNLMPEWGPDGRIYFISNRNGSDQIWSVTPRRALQAAGLPLPAPGPAYANATSTEEDPANTQPDTQPQITNVPVTPDQGP